MKSGHEQRFAKGEVIVKQGSKGDRVFLIRSGEVLICKNDDANILPIVKLGPGDLFGEMYLMSHDHLRNATVIALTEVIVHVFFEDVLMPDFQNMTPFQKVVMNGLNARLNSMNDSFIRLATTVTVGKSSDSETGGSSEGGFPLMSDPDHYL